MNNATATTFHSVRETARMTGLSEYFLRDGIRSGRIPFLRSGRKYLLSIDRVLAALDDQMEVTDGNED